MLPHFRYTVINSQTDDPYIGPFVLLKHFLIVLHRSLAGRTPSRPKVEQNCVARVLDINPLPVQRFDIINTAELLADFLTYLNLYFNVFYTGQDPLKSLGQFGSCVIVI